MTYEDIEKKFDGSGFAEPQKLYLITKAWWDFLKEQDKEIEQKVISENEFYFPEDVFPNRQGGHKKGERITDGDDACYLSGSDDWSRYYDLYYAEVKKRGLDKGYNRVIDCEARDMHFMAKNLLIDWVFEKASDFAKDKSEFALLKGFDVKLVKQSYLYSEKVCDLAMQIRG